MREIPKTNSPSSAKRMDDLSPASYAGQSDRITEDTKTGILGNRPIRVTKEVKYKEYENDKRETEDFDKAPDNGDPTQGFDGVETREPNGEPKKTFINTSFSEK